MERDLIGKWVFEEFITGMDSLLFDSMTVKHFSISFMADRKYEMLNSTDSDAGDERIKYFKQENGKLLAMEGI